MIEGLPTEDPVRVLISAPRPLESPSEIVANQPGNFKHGNEDGGGGGTRLGKVGSELGALSGLSPSQNSFAFLRHEIGFHAAIISSRRNA